MASRGVLGEQPVRPVIGTGAMRVWAFDGELLHIVFDQNDVEIYTLAEMRQCD